MQIYRPGNPIFAIPGESGLINIGKFEGPNVYDFTYVNMGNQVTMNNYEISQIPELASRFPANASTFGASPQNIDGHPIFLSVSDSTFLVGDVLIGDEKIFTHYRPYELFAHFPLNYGDSPPEYAFDVYDTTYNLNDQVLSTYFYNDFVDVETYGYGTLKLPWGDLECLRMIRYYSWYQFKEFFFLTKDGVMVVVTDVESTEPDTGYVQGDFIVLSSSDPSHIANQSISKPFEYKMDQNYPNPFNPETRIHYEVPISGHVHLSVFDNRGRLISTLVETFKTKGKHFVNFDGSQLPSGVYFYRIKIGHNFMDTKKMVLLQ
jgi:hypothetical protein